MVKAVTLRLIFNLADTFGWGIQQVDINNAFLKETILKKMSTFLSLKALLKARTCLQAL